MQNSSKKTIAVLSERFYQLCRIHFIQAQRYGLEVEISEERWIVRVKLFDKSSGLLTHRIYEKCFENLSGSSIFREINCGKTKAAGSWLHFWAFEFGFDFSRDRRVRHSSILLKKIGAARKNMRNIGLGFWRNWNFVTVRDMEIF